MTTAQMLENTVLVNTLKHNFKNFNEAKLWAKTNIVGRYKNNHTNEYIRISKTAIDKYLSESAIKKSVSLDVHLSALKKLPELIKTSILKEIKHDRYNDKNIKEIQRLYGAIYYERKTYPVKITIRVIKYEGHNAYSYEVIKIESPTTPKNCRDNLN